MNTSEVLKLPQADFEGGCWYVLEPNTGRIMLQTPPVVVLSQMPLVDWNMFPEMQIAKLD